MKYVGSALIMIGLLFITLCCGCASKNKQSQDVKNANEPLSLSSAHSEYKGASLFPKDQRKDEYIDLDSDGRADIFCDHKNYKRYIITQDEMIEVRASQRPVGQDVEYSLGRTKSYRFQDGEWLTSQLDERIEEAKRRLQEDPYDIRAIEILRRAELDE